MFGLQNFAGSCWVNACLQAVFRIPEVQTRYEDKEHDPANKVDACLQVIYESKGRDGLQEFFESVRTEAMPAGRSIGDSHELLVYLCDKLPFLDKLCRFKTADSIACDSCSQKDIREDTVMEYSLTSFGKRVPISDCIMSTVVPYRVPDWVCDKCKNSGCTKQQLIGTFPQVMIFHMISTDASVDYSSILSLNKNKYALLSVSCYNGSHWWGYGRNMPPGSSWYTLDDTSVVEHGPKEFPISGKMRLLIYYRLEN